MFSDYYDLERTRRFVTAGEHRELIGGLWDEIGKLARDLVISQGLTPEMQFLDIGCGCLRVGVHLVEYLEPGRYFGTDLSDELLTVGYECELKPRALDGKLPRQNLLCDDEFEFERFEGNPRFDMALALSVFTHLPINHLRLCLEKLEPRMPPGAKFLVTIFYCDDERKWSDPIRHQPGGVVTHPARDPYHHRMSDLTFCTQGLAWQASKPRFWEHPRKQALVVFTRRAD